MLGPWESGIESLHGTLGISQRLTVLLARCLMVRNESERNVRLLTLSTRSTRSLRTYSFLHLRLTALHPAFCQLYLGFVTFYSKHGLPCQPNKWTLMTKGMNQTFLAARFLLTLNGCAVSALAHDLPPFLFVHFGRDFFIETPSPPFCCRSAFCTSTYFPPSYIAQIRFLRSAKLHLASTNTLWAFSDAKGASANMPRHKRLLELDNLPISSLIRCAQPL